MMFLVPCFAMFITESFVIINYKHSYLFPYLFPLKFIWFTSVDFGSHLKKLVAKSGLSFSVKNVFQHFLWGIWRTLLLKWNPLLGSIRLDNFFHSGSSSNLSCCCTSNWCAIRAVLWLFLDRARFAIAFITNSCCSAEKYAIIDTQTGKLGWQS